MPPNEGNRTPRITNATLDLLEMRAKAALAVDATYTDFVAFFETASARMILDLVLDYRENNSALMNCIFDRNVLENTLKQTGRW